MVDRGPRVSGCLLGGAVGDALGAAIEFNGIRAVRRLYGPDGVTGFPEGEPGRITDDTQMALFTLEGLLLARRAGAVSVEARAGHVHHAYLRWLRTQDSSTDGGPGASEGSLLAEGWLHVQRSPGRTCLAALSTGAMGTVSAPLNDEKGCGGVMRAAPAGLLAGGTADAFDLGAATAAITHGHPSGYLSAAALAAAVHDLCAGAGLDQALGAARALLDERGSPAAETRAALDAGMALGRRGGLTAEDLESLGGGWVGEEALAIAVAAAVACPDDFAGAVLLAVNHSGDSDSTGAICGNLLGAALGVSAIPSGWVAALEGRATIERLAAEAG